MAQCKVLLSWHEGKPLAEYMEMKMQLCPPTKDKELDDAIDKILQHAEQEVEALTEAIAKLSRRET